jgi:hypothetical protein
MTDTAAFTRLVPGFDFLQGLVKNAGSALPNIGQWIAPTLNPEELEKRIEELRTVQFWLEQNARMLGATIQALEVQRMTLSTLKTMNVQMDDLRESLQIRPPSASASETTETAEVPARQKATSRGTAKSRARAGTPAGTGAGSPAALGVDPMQWWGALTKQFAELATSAVKDSATDAAKSLAGNMVKQSLDAAGQTLKKAAQVPAAVVRHATKTPRRSNAKS